jgi:predicted nucleic acid-binding protein
MVIVDSSVWIDALRGTINPETVWLRDAVGKRQIALMTLILCEVLQGVHNKAQFRGFQKDMLLLPIFETLSAPLAVESAQNYRRLRDRGITVRKTVDCLIATFCIEQGHRLLHRDRDFDVFETHLGLQVLHPPAIPLH